MISKILIYSKTRAFLLLMAAICVAISLASYSQNDPSFNLSTMNEPENLLGYFGSCMADFLYQLCGISAYLLPISLCSWSMLIYRKGFLPWQKIKIFSLLICIVASSVIFYNVKIPSLPADGGGVAGLFFYSLAINFSGEARYFVIPLALTITLVTLFVACGVKFSSLLALNKNFQKLIVKVQNIHSVLKKLLAITVLPKLIFGRFFSLFTNNQQKLTVIKSEPKISNGVSTSYAENEESLSITALKPSPSRKTSTSGNSVNPSEVALPSVDLLDEAHNQKIHLPTRAELEQHAAELLTVLNDFGVKGRIIDIRQGPVVTLYEFEPAAGTKSSRVIGLADDIARSLSALSTRIAVIPGRNVLGIELPNKQRMFFRLKELVTSPSFKNPDILLPIVLGKDLGGSPLIADLAKMPHLLVAGTTGSGKSVAINAMIMSLLYRYTPAECRMIMVDPKMLELSAYDNIPHLMTPVVTEPGKAVVALKWAVKEMENRYRIMSHLGVRNIANFNSKITETIKEGGTLERKIQTGFDPETGKPIFESVPIEMVKMPFIVVIVDEMADLMLVAGKDIEGSIQRLAQMARAAGIHLIMATQRPSVDVITGVIKANFPSRISFKVTSKIDSRTILGEQGAEQLLGMGDMLYMGNSSRILRVHGPFVDDKEVLRVTDFLRTTGTPEYILAVTEAEDDDFDPLSIEGSGNEADLYKQALNIVRTERKTSISYIQRSLRIGYNRAANLVEELEKNGIVSAPNHSGKREVLLPEG